MAEGEVATRDQESEAIRAEMQETRTNLSDKLETLEQGFKDAWQDATAAVYETMDDVRGTVATTVEAVQGAVHDTSEALRRAFDIPAQVRQHPWLMLGGALFVGYVVTILIGRPRC